MTSTVIALLEMPDAVDITFADEASFAGMAGAWLLVVICGIIVMFQTFKLIMEMAERYFILAVLTITSPLVGRSSRLMQRTSVLLPAPLIPMIP